MSLEATEMASIPRVELDVMKAQLRRLRREVARATAKERIESDPGCGSTDGPAFTREALAEAWGISE